MIMKRKPTLISAVLLSLGVGLFVYHKANRSSPDERHLPSNPAFVTNASSTLVYKPGASSPSAKIGTNATPDERKRMSDDQLVHWLDVLGAVPPDADAREWRLAQRTTWWGKPLDPKVFWEGKVVWLDGAASFAARSRGRGYPPPPDDNGGLPSFATDTDIDQGSLSDLEGPNLRFCFTSRESAFWQKFSRTHPKPPEILLRQQREIASEVWRQRSALLHSGNPARTTEQEISAIETSARQRAVELGFPEESLTPDALFWSYVMQMRSEYQGLIASGKPINTPSVVNLMRRIPFGTELITEPLTQDQQQKANSWKIAYLKRLRRENIGDSYINAYLKAWSLPPEVVSTKQPESAKQK